MNEALLYLLEYSSGKKRLKYPTIMKFAFLTEFDLECLTGLQTDDMRKHNRQQDSLSPREER